jgi:copper chaperone CopZ
MNSIRLNIEGLQENETQDKVKNQLESIVGVQNVDLSAGQTYLEVSYDDQTSDKEINSHLQNNGYKVMDMMHITDEYTVN